MSKAHEGKETTSLVNKENFVTKTICKKCGNLAIEGMCESTLQGSMVQKEYFVAGTEPKVFCDCHVKMTICEESNRKAGIYCPGDSKTTGVYLKSGTEGTEDAEYVIPENADESCSVHKAFWDDWFDEREHDTKKEELPKQDVTKENWWEDMFRDWFW